MHRRDISRVLFASATGALVAAPRLEAQTCTAPCYSQTSVEASLGITPVNLSYPSGNVLRYGADPTGMSSSQQAFNDALQVAVAGAGYVYAPSGLFTLNNPLVATISNPLRIYGDGCGLTVIEQTADSHVLNITQLNNSQSRLIVDNVKFLARSSAAMMQGRAISLQGFTNGMIGPARSLVVHDVVIQGYAATDEFKYGIWCDGVSTGFINGVQIAGASGSVSSVGIHIQATTTPAVANDIVAVQIDSCNVGVEISGSTHPGVEGLKLVDCDMVGVNFGLTAVNSLGLSVYAPPEILLVGCHINSANNCIDITAYIQVTITSCLLYRSGSAGAFMHLAAVQAFTINATTATLGSTDVPVIAFDGTVSICGSGTVDGIFWGHPGSLNRVISAAGTMFQIRVRGEMGGYAGWVPPVASPGYTGTIVCNPKDVIAPTADELSVAITPSGGTLDLTYVQSPYVVINASAVTITSIIPYGGPGANNGQRVTLECDSASVVLQHNATQLMPGGTNYQFTPGSTIDLYHFNASTWRSVGTQ